MLKNKINSHTEKHAKTKDGDATKKHDLHMVVIGHLTSSGWIQNLGIGFVFTGIALLVAWITCTGFVAAAITFATVGVIFVGLTIFIALRSKLEEPQIAYFGALTPGNEPISPLPQNCPPETVQLLLGDDLRVLSASENPVFTRKGESFLTISVSNGLMKITATLLDSDNLTICRIIDNEFQAHSEWSFNPKQPDKHSLIVRNTKGEQVLHIQFRNPKTIWLVGRFYIPGATEPLLILQEDGVRWPGGGGIGHLTMDMTKTRAGAIELGWPN